MLSGAPAHPEAMAGHCSSMGIQKRILRGQVPANDNGQAEEDYLEILYICNECIILLCLSGGVFTVRSIMDIHCGYHTKVHALDYRGVYIVLDDW